MAPKTNFYQFMRKALTKSPIAATIADKIGTTMKQTTQTLDLLASCMAGVLFALCITGCATLSSLPPNDAAYFRAKITPALASGRANPMGMCIEKMAILNQKGRCAIITLAEGYDETDCLKAMRALARDPLVPMVDKICITVDRTETRGIGVKETMGSDTTFSSWHTSSSAITVFSCVITRDALLRGEEPRPVIRNGVFVSGPYEGQRTDSLWLHENKGYKKAKPAAPAANQTEQPAR